jgi:hypothetical protein
VCRVPISCFARPDSFTAVSSASGAVFMFYTREIIFDGTEGVGSSFHVLRARTRFRPCRVRRVPFSCFAHSDSFSTVFRASDPDFMFCAPGLVFGGTDGVGSRFHVLRAWTHFRRYRGRRVLFSCFVLRNSFSAVPRASCRFFMFSAPGLIFGGTEGVGSRFHVLRARTLFRRYLERRVPFSCFACPDSFSAVSSASGPVFMFYAPILIFDGTEGVGSHFHVLCSRTLFRSCRVRRVPF